MTPEEVHAMIAARRERERGTKPCPDCYGSGSWSETMLGQRYPCDTCNETGRVPLAPGEPEHVSPKLADYARTYPYPSVPPIDWQGFVTVIGAMFRAARQAEEEAVYKILTAKPEVTP